MTRDLKEISLDKMVWNRQCKTKQGEHLLDPQAQWYVGFWKSNITHLRRFQKKQ